MPSVTSPGIGSGLDIQSLVSQLVAFEGQNAADRLSRREAGFQATLSGLGTFRAALDSFRSALEPLKDVDKFSARTASSSNEDLFTVSADGTADPGEYSIEVVSLAQSHKLSSAAFASSDDPIGTGTLTISLDTTSFDVEILDLGESSLRNIRDAINAEEKDVIASIVNAQDGAHLVLSSTKTGADNEITVQVSGGDGGLTPFIYDPAGGTTNLSESQAAADAEILIDSFSHLSATNIVSAAIDGLTIELESADPGTPATLSVGLDLDQTRVLIEDFVDAYNSLVRSTGDLTRYDPETKTAGLLQGNSIVTSLTDRMSREFNRTVDGYLRSLRDINLSVALDGTIEIDANPLGLTTDKPTLDEVLAENFNDVSNLFADGENGFAVRFDVLMDEYLQADGLIDSRVDGLNDSIGRINDQRERLDQHLIAVEERYRIQFQSLDSLIASLNNTSGFLGAQLANLPSPAALLGKG
ncbi:MAG: flagellar filament capping protein FliD [Gammaproteobacteria bacterium]|nr:flagellar filament capping protein FliD [Gammaproteobacteria bacterium]NNF60024.1 flagellar filament capping protein FliD [Gammaproteobacteria bacterium]NNM19955.1 flagellar filament capping protein FliD [Gammaproteobacteria bacterium]